MTRQLQFHHQLLSALRRIALPHSEEGRREMEQLSNQASHTLAAIMAADADMIQAEAFIKGLRKQFITARMMSCIATDGSIACIVHIHASAAEFSAAAARITPAIISINALGRDTSDVKVAGLKGVSITLFHNPIDEGEAAQ